MYHFFIKNGVSYKEFFMHDYIYTLSLSSDGVLHIPRIINYDANRKEMTIEKINHINLYDYYGTNESNIKPALFTQIHSAINYLYNCHIIYPAIIPSNFIECGGKLWITDFEQCDFLSNEKNAFVEKFITDLHYNKWNPLFTLI